jgi:catechol 2,3-dioxygenase-like lactoylglutathione lyase family enzyme
MPIRLAVASLWADNVPETAHFYRDVIGLQLLSHHGHYPHFDLGGCYLVILKGKPVPPQDPTPERFPIFAFSVDDLDEAMDRLRAHQVELPWGIERDSTSRWAMFHDPAGNLIELAELKSH